MTSNPLIESNFKLENDCVIGREYEAAKTSREDEGENGSRQHRRCDAIER